MMVVIVFNDDEVVLRDDEIFAIDLPENLRLQHLGGGPGREQFGLEQHQPIDAGADLVKVMGEQQHGQSEFLMELFDQLDYVVLCRDIEAGGGLVQQQDLRLLRQGPGDKYPLLLTSRELPQSGVAMAVHRHVRERSHGDLAVLPAGTREQPQGPIAAHHHRFEDGNGKIPVHHPLLWQVPDLRAMMAAQLITGTIKNMEMPFERRNQAQHRTAQRGFARSVGADDADEFPRPDIQRYVLQCHDPGEPEGGVIKADNGLTDLLHEDAALLPGLTSQPYSEAVMRPPGRWLIGAHYGGACRGRCPFPEGRRARL